MRSPLAGCSTSPIALAGFCNNTYHVIYIGGGFGGKETRSCLLSTATAVAAHKLVRPHYL